MFRPFFILFCLLFSTSISAQQYQVGDLGCGTVSTPQQMQLISDYVSGKVQFKRTSLVDTVPLSIHIVGKNNGTGTYTLNYLFSLLCDLNLRFAPVGFYFYIKWPIRYIYNNNYYDHDYNDGEIMMMVHNVPETVNIYFVGNPNG